MKYTLSKAQKQKIKDAQQKVAALTREMDVAFDDLVKELGFEKYQEAYDSSIDLLHETINNPINVLFDVVYNTQDEEKLDADIKNIELRVLAYHLE